MPYTKSPGLRVRCELQSPFIAMDFARAICAIIVFLSHVRGGSFVEFGALPPEHQGILTKLLFAVTRLGHEAVLVFFVLSGFLVGGQVIRGVQAKRFDIGRFALDRATRILLPLVPACLLTVAITVFLLGGSVNWPQAFGNMFGFNGILVDTLPGNAPLWSLAYEIWFYLLAGALGYLAVRGNRAWLALPVVVACVFVFMRLDVQNLIFWCLGALMVLYMGVGHRRKLAVVGAIASALGVLGYQLGIESKSGVQNAWMPLPIAEALVVVGICLAIPYMCTLNSRLVRVGRLSSYLASLSYTLYLVHYPINEAAALIMPKAADLSWYSLSIFAARVAMIFGAANVCYWLFEANTDVVRKYLGKRLFSPLKVGVGPTPLT